MNKKLLLILLTFSIVIPNLFAQPVEGRKKVALVLGGGGAKGAAHVGVLKYIEQSGIPIDYIVGTSIGSIVGGLYSCGYRSDDLEKLFISQEWIDLLTDRSDSHKGKILKEEDGVTYIFGFPISNKNRAANKKQGILRGDSITSFLGRLTEREDSIDFDRLPIPFRCVAVDINTFKEVIFKEGSLPLAMRASMAIPLAFNTVQINGKTLVDGGLLNNLPVDVAKEMGADYIIAVDLTVNKHEDAEPDITDDYIGGNNNLLNILKWITDRPDLAKYRKNVEDATIYISPDLAGFSAAQFSAEKIVEMIRRGEDAGKMALQPLVDLKNAL